jgi:hypothetical protein
MPLSASRGSVKVPRPFQVGGSFTIHYLLENTRLGIHHYRLDPQRR